MDSVLRAQILAAVNKCARIIKDPTGRPVTVISEFDSREVAKQSDCLLGDVHKTALAAEIWPYRYLRNRCTLTSGDQLKLSESAVAVIGCGGLGGYVILMLARIGIGSLVIVDPDKFDETNLNRQAFALSDTMEMPKIDVGIEVVNSVNPAVDIKGFKTALAASNADEILFGYDVVVDALDNLPDREMLLRETRRMKIPLVHGAIAGFEGQVMAYDPGHGPQIDIFKHANEQDAENNPNAEAILGVPSITPVFIASLQSMEVIKILLNRGKPFRNRILYSDIESGEFNYLDFDA